MKRRAEDYGKRGEQTRKRILDAAFRLIGRENGLHLRVDEVCTEVPISRAAFYHYFASLEELLAALSLELSHDFNQGVLAAIARMETSTQRADAGTRYYLEKAIQDPSWGWAMIHISATGPLFGAETAAAALATIGEGIATGEFDIVDAEMGRDMLQGAVLAAIAAQLRGSHGKSSPAAVSRFILRGLGVERQLADEVVARRLPAITGGATPASIASTSPTRSACL